MSQSGGAYQGDRFIRRFALALESRKQRNKKRLRN